MSIGPKQVGLRSLLQRGAEDSPSHQSKNCPDSSDVECSAPGEADPLVGVAETEKAEEPEEAKGSRSAVRAAAILAPFWFS